MKTYKRKLFEFGTKKPYKLYFCNYYIHNFNLKLIYFLIFCSSKNPLFYCLSSSIYRIYKSKFELAYFIIIPCFKNIFKLQIFNLVKKKFEISILRKGDP